MVMLLSSDRLRLEKGLGEVLVVVCVLVLVVCVVVVRLLFSSVVIIF